MPWKPSSCFLISGLSTLHYFISPKFSSLKILHHNENMRFSQGGNYEWPGHPMKISLTVAYCQRPFLFQHHRLLHYMLFSKDDCHLRGKISLPLSGELPYWGGGKGFLTASDLQIPFWLQKLLSQTWLCSEKLFLILFTYKLKMISSCFCRLRGPISGWLTLKCNFVPTDGCSKAGSS